MSPNAPGQGDFNAGLLSGIRQNIRELELDIAIAERKAFYARNMRDLLAIPQWRVVIDDLGELLKTTTTELTSRQCTDYRQGRLHGVVHVIKMIVDSPSMTEEQILKIENEDLPLLRESLEVCKKLLGPAR